MNNKLPKFPETHLDLELLKKNQPFLFNELINFLAQEVERFIPEVLEEMRLEEESKKISA